MTDRGLPIVDGAPACPFVAFEDDRDGRALAPDHRHRCFAEPRPAPRALAHQEAYCLSSAFPVCPTFQDWARREAAAARVAPPDDRPPREEPPVSRPMPPLEREPRHASGETPQPLPPRRNPHRNWAAPPPWSGDEDEPGGPAAPPPFLAGRGQERDDEAWAVASRGLAGSAADRLAGPDPDAGPAPRPDWSDATAAAERRDEADDAGDLDEDDGAWAPPSRPAHAPERSPQERYAPDRAGRDPGRAGERGPGRGSAGTTSAQRREQARRRREEEAAELFGPAWERPRRYEAYPSLRTRVGLPSFSRLGIGVLALILAAVVLFFGAPILLNLGGDDPGSGGTASQSPATQASASARPTAPPAPTPTVHVVAKGDTMSKIAKTYGVTIEQLLAANKQIKDPDKIKIGDEITIPVATPSEAPAGDEATPEP
jgi:nucleoid-associated protein YgaU